jgi:hypothetical protein
MGHILPYGHHFKGQKGLLRKNAPTKTFCGQAAVKAYHSRHAAAFMARELLDSCRFSGEE